RRAGGAPELELGFGRGAAAVHGREPALGRGLPASQRLELRAGLADALLGLLQLGGEPVALRRAFRHGLLERADPCAHLLELALLDLDLPLDLGGDRPRENERDQRAPPQQAPRPAQHHGARVSGVGRRIACARRAALQGAGRVPGHGPGPLSPLVYCAFRCTAAPYSRMEQYLEFTANHPLLVSALTLSFLLLVFTEIRRKT